MGQEAAQMMLPEKLSNCSRYGSTDLSGKGDGNGRVEYLVEWSQEEKYKWVLSFAIGNTRIGNLYTGRISLGVPSLSSDFLPLTRILHGQESTEVKTTPYRAEGITLCFAVRTE